MGSSSSTVIANLCMIYIEEETIKNLPCGKDTFLYFWTYLNNINHRIDFNLEIEEYRQLLFLDPLITTKLTGNLG